MPFAPRFFRSIESAMLNSSIAIRLGGLDFCRNHYTKPVKVSERKMMTMRLSTYTIGTFTICHASELTCVIVSDLP